jgi:hypothetical protein
LAEFVEPRYLHQTFARGRDGVVRSITDLSREFCAAPPREFADSEAWRIHFHVPVNTTDMGPLRSTRRHMVTALETVLSWPDLPHLEVETYTWPVLSSGVVARPSLVDGLLAELQSTQGEIDRICRG